MSTTSQFVFGASGTSAATKFGFTVDGAGTWSNTGGNGRLSAIDSSGVSITLGASESIGQFLTFRTPTEDGASVASAIPRGARNISVTFTVSGTLDATGMAEPTADFWINASDGTISGQDFSGEFIEPVGTAGTVAAFTETSPGGDLGLSDLDLADLLRNPSTVFYLSPQNASGTGFGITIDQIVLTVTWDDPSFESVPTYESSASGAQWLRRTLAGLDRTLVCTFGDSNFTQTGAGGLMQGALNIHTLRLMLLAADGADPSGIAADGQIYLWTSGWHMPAAPSGSYYSCQLPVYVARSGGTNLNAEAAYTGLSDAGEAGFCQSLPAGCNDIQSPAPLGSETLYVNATTGNGLFMTLQSVADNAPPEFPWGVGPGVRLWDTRDGHTKLIVANAKCSTAGFAKEIQLLNTRTDTLYAAISPSAAQTIKSAAGGVTALNLNDTALVTSDDANGRATPVFGVYGAFNFGSNKAIQVTGLGLASDGSTIAKAIWAGFGFVSTRGTGFGWATLGAHGTYAAHHHTYRHPYCQAYIRGFRDAHLSVNSATNFAVRLQVGQNAGYVTDPVRGTYASGAEYAQDMVDLYDFLCDAFEDDDLRVLLEAPQLHDNSEAASAAGASADSKDDVYRTYAYHLLKRARAGDFGTRWSFCNGTRIHDAEGFNRRGENLITFGTATGTGVHAVGTTTFTQSNKTYDFHAGLVGRKIVINGTGTYTVAGYTSATVITLTGNATSSGKGFCFLPAMLSTGQSDITPPWDASTTYIPGDLVKLPGVGGFVECRTGHSNIHPIGSSSGPTYWKGAKRRYNSVSSAATPDGSHCNPTSGVFAMAKATVDALPMAAAYAPASGGVRPLRGRN